MKTISPKAKKNIQIPNSWQNVAGILKGKKRVEALKYQQTVRKEWARLLKLAVSKHDA